MQDRITITLTSANARILDRLKQTKNFNTSGYMNRLMEKEFSNPLEVFMNQYKSKLGELSEVVVKIRNILKEYNLKGEHPVVSDMYLSTPFFEDIEKLRKEINKDKKMTEYIGEEDKK